MRKLPLCGRRVEVFPFRFTAPYRPLAWLFGVVPSNTYAVVGRGRLDVRFGPWRLATGLGNVRGTELVGPFAVRKTAGPARLSLVDRGITFATNKTRGVCVRFHGPVKALDPFGLIRHPAATVTVADPQRLAARLDPFRLRGGVRLLRATGLRGEHLRLAAMMSLTASIGMWISAKTVDQNERAHAEHRALLVGLWPFMLWLFGYAIEQRHRASGSRSSARKSPSRVPRRISSEV